MRRSMLLLLVGAIVLIVLVTCFCMEHRKVYIKSNIDGNHYKVLKDTTENMTEVADTLAQIHQRIELLITHLKSHGASQHLVDILHSKYSNDIMSEAVIQDGYTSYTVNKKNIHMCLRSRDSAKKVYDINTLMYVIIHELAHLIGKETGHTNDFKRIFKHLLRQAIEIGIYEYIDYSRNPVDYCGLKLTTNILQNNL